MTSTKIIDRKAIATSIRRNTPEFFRMLTNLVFTKKGAFVASYDATTTEIEIPNGIAFFKCILTEGLEALIYWGNVADEDHNLLSANINRDTVELPSDNHVGWKTSAISTGKAVVRMKIDGTPYVLDIPTEFKVEDVQIVRLGNGNVTVHIFDGNDVHMAMIDSNLAPASWKKILTNVTALLTLYGENTAHTLYAKKDVPGLFLNDVLIPDTELKIDAITTDSEANKVFVTTVDGKLLGMTYNWDGKTLVVSKPFMETDIISANHRLLFAGPDVVNGLFVTSTKRTGGKVMQTGVTIPMSMVA